MGRSLARTLVLGAIVASSQLRPSAQAGGSVSVPIATLLDWYLEGRPVVSSTINPKNPGQIVRSLERNGEQWIAAGDGPAQPRRRLAAATLALEIGHALPDLDRVPLARRLTVWGDNVLRSGPVAGGSDRLWALASIALLESVDDWVFLYGPRKIRPPEPSGQISVLGILDRGYLLTMRAQFADEPRIALASAVASENISWMVGSFGRLPGSADGFISGELTKEYLDALDRGDLVLSDGSRWTGGDARKAGKMHIARVDELRDLARDLEGLTKIDTVAAEAHLRLGLIHVRLTNRDTALEQFAAVEPLTTDPALIYLSRFFAGLVYERQGRDAAGIDAYRAALRIQPGVQSSTVRLARLLFKAGLHADAAAAAETFFAAPAGAVDPCATYRTGDARLWNAYLERLREAWR